MLSVASCHIEVNQPGSMMYPQLLKDIHNDSPESNVVDAGLALA